MSMLSHLWGALLALIGLVVLLRRAEKRGLPHRSRIALATYAGSSVFTFAASALFHYFPAGTDALVLFKKLDHAAIFVLIGGTCTVLLEAGGREGRRRIIAACWIVCGGALVLKMVFWPMALWMTASVYLAVGWVAGVSVLRAMRHVPWRRLRWLVYGMLIHSAAAVVFATEAPVLWPGVVEGHEMFHVMVLAGVALHFYFVHEYCTLPEGLCAAKPERRRAVSLAADPRES